jgi:hypothetical protein
MGQKLNVVDSSGLTDADWAAVNRVNRACELGGATAFWEKLEKLDDMSLQLRVLGAFFPELVREVIEEEMTEHGLTIDDLREAERKAESPLVINRLSKFSGLFHAESCAILATPTEDTLGPRLRYFFTMCVSLSL